MALRTDENNKYIETRDFIAAGFGVSPGDVEILDASVSDRHNGGKSAAVFVCRGKKYVFKHRARYTDDAWADFLDSLSVLGAEELPLAVRPAAGDGDFTIVPFVEVAPAANDSEAREFYRRWGALLALCHMLGSNDMHSENVIAGKGSPVLVDLETLLPPVVTASARRDGMLDTLLFSHFLPCYKLEDDKNVDIGALTGAGVNMLKASAGEVLPPYMYAGAIDLGFCRTYHFLLSRRDEVSRLLGLFSRCRFRHLIRPTDVYGRLVDIIAARQDDDAKKREAERLARAYERDARPGRAEYMAPVCRSEISAVLRGDIPYFYAPGDSRAICDGSGELIEDYFDMPPVERARLRLDALNEAGMEDERRIIRQSLAASAPLPVKPRAYNGATDIFEHLENNAVGASACSWIGIDTDERGTAFLQSVGFGLYGGLLGILCFYAAFYAALRREAGDEGARADDIRPYRTETAESVRRCGADEESERVLSALYARYGGYREYYVLPDSKIRPTSESCGLTSGLGGHLLALAYIAKCTGDESFLRDGARVFARFDFSDCNFKYTDFYSGCSGLAAALPIIKPFADKEALCFAAKTLAESLLTESMTLTGLAHGAAGYALALAACCHVLGSPEYDGDVLRLLKWENTHYSGAAHNWTDLREGSNGGFMRGVCSGTPGVAASRLAISYLTSNSEIKELCAEDIRRAGLYFDSERPPKKRDTLCCGSAAHVKLAALLDRADICGDDIKTRLLSPTLYSPLETDAPVYGLFQGLAGAGYALSLIYGAPPLFSLWGV